MKLETWLIISKAMAYLIVGVFTPWTAALAQWVNSGEWPPKIIWIAVILPASAISGANAWIAFTSASWTNYKATRQNGGDTVILPKPTP